MGTRVTITNTANGKTTSCTVNDRGPTLRSRVIDLHPDQFAEIADLSTGVVEVTISW
jgi:rare lipoprotein A